MDVNELFVGLRERWAVMARHAGATAGPTSGPYREMVREAEELTRLVDDQPTQGMTLGSASRATYRLRLPSGKFYFTGDAACAWDVHVSPT